MSLRKGKIYKKEDFKILKQKNVWRKSKNRDMSPKPAEEAHAPKKKKDFFWVWMFKKKRDYEWIKKYGEAEDEEK